MTFSLIVPAVIALLFALGMLFQKTLYAGAFCLLMVLLQIAVLFFALGAQLLAMMQVLIYTGAVMVLVVIAIMAANPDMTQRWAEFRISPWLGGALLGIAIIEAVGLYHLRAASPAPMTLISSGMERAMAGLLFGPYALMTEAIGLVVLVSALAVLQE